MCHTSVLPEHFTLRCVLGTYKQKNRRVLTTEEKCLREERITSFWELSRSHLSFQPAWDNTNPNPLLKPALFSTAVVQKTWAWKWIHPLPCPPLSTFRGRCRLRWDVHIILPGPRRNPQPAPGLWVVVTQRDWCMWWITQLVASGWNRGKNGPDPEGKKMWSMERHGFYWKNQSSCDWIPFCSGSFHLGSLKLTIS